MAKVYTFKRRDKNRFRKVYRYIRKKPVYEFCSPHEFEMIAGYVDFVETDGPVTYTYPPSVIFSTAPIAIVTSVDSLSNNQANVNAFVSSISTSNLKISVSDKFSGRVHFVIVGQD